MSRAIFDSGDIRQLSENSFWFECSMISACAPVFDKCYSNYCVRDILTEVGVIDSTCDEDTESCALVINFNSLSAGQAFIGRLNRYLTQH